MAFNFDPGQPLFNYSGGSALTATPPASSWQALPFWPRWMDSALEGEATLLGALALALPESRLLLDASRILRFFRHQPAFSEPLWYWSLPISDTGNALGTLSLSVSGSTQVLTRARTPYAWATAPDPIWYAEADQPGTLLIRNLGYIIQSIIPASGAVSLLPDTRVPGERVFWRITGATAWEILEPEEAGWDLGTVLMTTIQQVDISYASTLYRMACESISPQVTLTLTGAASPGRPAPVLIDRVMALTRHRLWTIWDEFGLVLDQERLPGEDNPGYALRLLGKTRSPGGVQSEPLALSLGRDLGRLLLQPILRGADPLVINTPQATLTFPDSSPYETFTDLALFTQGSLWYGPREGWQEDSVLFAAGDKIAPPASGSGAIIWDGAPITARVRTSRYQRLVDSRGRTAQIDWTRNARPEPVLIAATQVLASLPEPGQVPPVKGYGLTLWGQGDWDEDPPNPLAYDNALRMDGRLP